LAERGQVVTRGVLLDAARKNGLKHLSPNTIVTPEELDATSKSAEWGCVGRRKRPGSVSFEGRA